MTFSAKLEHSTMNGDDKAKQMCALLDFLNSAKCRMPSERELAEIFGMTRYKLRLLLVRMNEAGIVNQERGKGRSTNTYNKSADIKALEQRQDDFKQECWTRFKEKYKWFVIERFTDYWGEADLELGKMRWEKEKTFEITRRMKRFRIDGKAVKAAETPEELAEVASVNNNKIRQYIKNNRQ